MGHSKFEKTENSMTEMDSVVYLVQKVMRSGFGEVVIKVQDGKIVLLEERLTHKPTSWTNSLTKL